MLATNQFDGTDESRRLRRSVQPTNRVVSAQFSGLEVGSNSFIVNKLSKKEIDQDDDYTEYDDYEDELENEIEKKKLANEANKVFSSKQSRQVTSRPKADKPANDQVKSTNRSVHNGPIGQRSADGQAEKSGNKIVKQKSSVAKGANRKQTIGESTDGPASNSRQISGQINSQTSNSRQVRQPIGNEQLNEFGIEIENMIKNVVSRNDDQQAASSAFRSPGKLDLVYAYDSPNYCTANSYLKILGTVNRSCRKMKRNLSDSCDTLCCGRGYDKRIMHKTEECQCEFDAVSVGVKCKTCEFAFETFTCK